jgi:hypothetical protein
LTPLAPGNPEPGAFGVAQAIEKQGKFNTEPSLILTGNQFLVVLNRREGRV